MKLSGGTGHSDFRGQRNARVELPVDPEESQAGGRFPTRPSVSPDWSILDNLEGEYATSIRFLKSGYRRDMGRLRRYSTSTRKISYSDAIRALSKAKEILDIQGKLESGYAGSKKVLGQFYLGEETNWASTIGGLEWLSPTGPQRVLAIQSLRPTV